MSKHVTLTLHYPEETVAYNFSTTLVPFPSGRIENPISDYFSSTTGLIRKIISDSNATDAEILGLLLLGVISSAEFYFRRVLSELGQICPICQEHTEALNIPSGATQFYARSRFAAIISAFEHESLADSKKIAAEIKRFSAFACADDLSVKQALEDFELLCELRHCLVHSRGFAGFKAIRALRGRRKLHKVIINQAGALDLIKVSHNAVRAVNHYLGNELLNRWIDREVLKGIWRSDKKNFTKYWNLFSKAGEDAYSGSPEQAYATTRPLIVKRRQAVAANTI